MTGGHPDGALLKAERRRQEALRQSNRLAQMENEAVVQILTQPVTTAAGAAVKLRYALDFLIEEGEARDLVSAALAVLERLAAQEGGRP